MRRGGLVEQDTHTHTHKGKGRRQEGIWMMYIGRARALLSRRYVHLVYVCVCAHTPDPIDPLRRTSISPSPSIHVNFDSVNK